MKRRDVVSSLVVGAGIGLSGCSSLSSGERLSWDEAFDEELSDQDRSTLEPTPVVQSEVTTQAEVTTALGVLGWTRGVVRLDRSITGELDTLISTTEDILAFVTPVSNVLDEGLALVDEMKATAVAGVSVWDVATTAKPGLSQFEILVREFNAELSTFITTVESVHESSVTTNTHISNIANRGMTAYGDLPTSIQTATADYSDIGQDVDPVRSIIGELRDIATEAVDTAAELPALSADVRRVFSAISREFSNLYKAIREFEGGIELLNDGLVDLRADADSIANARYAPVSKSVTGSRGEMDVTQIEVAVDAYHQSKN